jgi:ABC-type nitrate/sulfonate/bicarbonate transport system substrate-binding protein
MIRKAYLASAIAGLFFACALPAAAQQQPTRIRVSLGDVSLNKLIFVIAQEQGIYKKNGLEIEQYITPRAAGVVANSGVHIPPEYVKEFDEEPPIAIGGGSPHMVRTITSARADNRVIVASTDNTVRWHIIAQPEIKRLEDLKGKRIGYSGYGAMTHFMALSFVLRMGWDPDQDVSLLSDALAVDTLKNRKVDAFIGDEVARVMAAVNGFNPLQDMREWNLPIAGSGINVEREWLKNNRDAVRRFVKATVEALAIMKQNRDAGMGGIGKWYNIKDREQQRMIIDYADGLGRKPYPAVEGIKRVMEIYNTHEMRRHKPEDFYDDSFVRELDQSGYIDSLYR